MTEPHLDDEQLSLLLDGLAADGRAHVEDGVCEPCAARLASLRTARDAVAAAVVAPLPADVVDRVVGAALDAPVVAPALADVVPMAASPRRRRRTTPPPAWLLGAAAGIAVLVGVAGVLRVADPPGSGDDEAGLATTAADQAAEAESSVGGGAPQLPAAGTAATGTVAAVDPERVIGDLADVDDAVELALALDGLRLSPAAAAPSSTSNFPARQSSSPVAGSGATGGAAASEEATTDKAAAASPAPATTAPADRAQCRPEADAIGAGRFAALLSTATLRWKGQTAEVLVFRLAEPSAPDAPETRQALVLSRPGCQLLADPRF